jgi:VanZ family protein
MKIAPDKKKHFLVGIVMGAVLQTIFLFFLPHQLWYATALSLIFSFAIAYGFELYSKFTGRGHYELMDAIAALIGALPGIASVILLHLL